MTHFHRSEPARIATAALSLLAATALLGGCALGKLVGGMAASAERSGSKEVKAKYAGMADRNFAVIVAADRAIQADHPNAVPIITSQMTVILAKQLDGVASGYLPAEEVLRFQYQRPGWVAMSPQDIAKELNVERLVFIDLQEYSLTDPGNPYVWNAEASGIIGVTETDAKIEQDFSFRERVKVRFPDNDSTSAEDIPRETVEQVLRERFIARSSWLFFTHEEPNAIKF